MSPLEAGFEGAQSLATFLNLCGFRVPGNDILALDEVQTVLYTHMVITRFLYRSAGLNELQSLTSLEPGQNEGQQTLYKAFDSYSSTGLSL